MTKKELKDELKLIKFGEKDEELDHINADDLLLRYINDREVTALFTQIKKWYS